MARRKNVLRSGAFAIAAGALLLSATLPSSAQDRPDATGDIPVMSHEEALSLDAEELAKTSTLNKQEMETRLRLESEIAGPIEEIRAISGSRLSAVYIIPDEALAVHVRLTGAEEIERLFQFSSTLPVPVIVEYGATYSEDELVEAANKISEQIWLEKVEGVDGVEVSGTSESLVFFLNSDADDSTRKALSGITSDVFGAKTDNTIKVTFEQYEGSAGDTGRGGVRISGCTSGFTVKSGAVLGFVTAGHCANLQAYATTPTGLATNSTVFKSENRSSTADLQWNSPAPGETYRAFFGSSATSLTVQLGTKTATVGQSLCHRGLTTGYSCGAVISLSYAPTWSNACNGVACSAAFVRTSGAGLANLGGDSGGPWFGGAYAYGLHKGGLSDTSNAWAVYTPIAKISTLGVSLFL